MKEVNDYVVRQETMLFLPRFNKNGNLTTYVLESDREYYVGMEPKALMDHCLGYYGSSLRGATDGAKKILGNIHMCPIVVNEKLNLYWLSTKSSNQKDCVWFALHHIKNYESEGVTETKVTLNNGIQITVDVSLYTFKRKIERAYQLKGKLEERSKLHFMTVGERKSVYQIRRPAGVLNYEMEKK